MTTDSTWQRFAVAVAARYVAVVVALNTALGIALVSAAGVRVDSLTYGVWFLWCVTSTAAAGCYGVTRADRRHR